MIIGEKNTDLKRLTGQLKLPLFDRNWAISLKLRQRKVPHFAWFQARTWISYIIVPPLVCSAS
jgi:hypothetical protein